MNLENKSPEELAVLIAEAQAQLQNRQQSKRKEVLAQIKELAASIDVIVQIIESPKKTDKRASSVAAKYRNPANSAETWTGRGLMPKWLRHLVDSGRNKDEFLIHQ